LALRQDGGARFPVARTSGKLSPRVVRQSVSGEPNASTWTSGHDADPGWRALDQRNLGGMVPEMDISASFRRAVVARVAGGGRATDWARCELQAASSRRRRFPPSRESAARSLGDHAPRPRQSQRHTHQWCGHSELHTEFGRRGAHGRLGRDRHGRARFHDGDRARPPRGAASADGAGERAPRRSE
jgi:hypothetical protein